MPLPSNNLYSIKILSWLMWKSFKSSSYLCFRRWYQQWPLITWPLTSNWFKFQKKKKKVDINICSLQSIFQNSKHRKQKKTFKFNFIKMKGKLIFDHIIRYIDFKKPAFNFEFCFVFFSFPYMSNCKSTLGIQWLFVGVVVVLLDFFLKRNPHRALKTKQKSPQNTKPTLLSKIICISPLCSDRKWRFPSDPSRWEIVAEGQHPVFKESLLMYLE